MGDDIGRSRIESPDSRGRDASKIGERPHQNPVVVSDQLELYAGRKTHGSTLRVGKEQRIEGRIRNAGDKIENRELTAVDEDSGINLGIVGGPAIVKDLDSS